MKTQSNITSNLKLNQAELLDAFFHTRNRSLELIRTLQPEDLNLQVDVFTSPPKWHLAHTSWFFETFILKQFFPEYKVFNENYEYLFNSYYNAIGELYPRAQRGFLSRPCMSEIIEYRHHIDHSIRELCTAGEPNCSWLPLLELGMHHELQHQELLLTDIKYSLFQNPLYPVFRESLPAPAQQQVDLCYVSFAEGTYEIGMNSQDGTFGYDNEMPKHKHLQLPFSLASRHTTNAEYLDFIEDGGYEKPELWIADGWEYRKKHKWQAPLYWQKSSTDQWKQFTLSGLKNLCMEEPVCHVSYFEADAYARWAGARLPTEHMLEIACKNLEIGGQFYSEASLHPKVACEEGKLQDLYGKVWEWTRSPYMAYHGYQAAAGAVGEYNGKFMCNQFVLRGGSCLTQVEQMRPSYRNFFYPHERWQMSGIRLAEEN